MPFPIKKKQLFVQSHTVNLSTKNAFYSLQKTGVLKVEAVSGLFGDLFSEWKPFLFRIRASFKWDSRADKWKDIFLNFTLIDAFK